MAEVVVVGGGGHAKVLIGVLRNAGHQVLGYLSPNDQGPVLSAAWLGSDDHIRTLRERHSEAVAALGVGKVAIDDGSRLDLTGVFETAGFRFPSFLSPRSSVDCECELGAGTVAFDGSVVNPGTLIGRASIINTNATVEHDCTIGDDVHIGPGAVVCGDVDVGQGSIIGPGAVVARGTSIVAGVQVGAGSVVIRDIGAPGTYVGSPARRVE